MRARRQALAERMRGVAARHPAFDVRTQGPIRLAQRSNAAGRRSPSLPARLSWWRGNYFSEIAPAACFPRRLG